jgi:hypothetical protein
MQKIKIIKIIRVLNTLSLSHAQTEWLIVYKQERRAFLPKKKRKKKRRGRGRERGERLKHDRKARAV